MFQKIVVPLDGSKLAECVLDHVEEMAKDCDTKKVILVSVTERVTGVSVTKRVSGVTPLASYAKTIEPLSAPEPVTSMPVTIGKKQQQAQRYLDRIAKRLAGKGVKVQTAVLLGNPAEEIIHYAQKNDCGLIAMASHGRSGISRWAYGSVADKILRASTVAVLIVKAPGSLPGA